jgi:hypothetical protein
MPPRNRSHGRNVFIYNTEGTWLLGGMIRTNGVTNGNLYSMVEIFVIINGTWELRRADDSVVERNDDPLSVGSYYIVADGQLMRLSIA